MDIIRLDEIMGWTQAPSEEYSLANGNASETKAPSDEGAVAKGDWGSEKVSSISHFAFRLNYPI